MIMLRIRKKKYITEKIYNNEFELFKQNWSIELNNQKRANGSRGKLRSYRLFKSEYKTENYLTVNLPVHHRSALAKFGCGVAPIRIETGRYERLPLESRLCVQCNSLENECHVICESPLYQDLRNSLFEYAKPVIRNFESLNTEEKMSAVLSNSTIVKHTAKIFHEILVRKRSFTYTLVRIKK